MRRVFELQAGGKVAEAARETEHLQNDVLLGAILADRYLRNPASAAELSAWLNAFGDQPEAPAIRGLLEMMAPPAAAPAPDPEASGRGTGRSPADARRLFVENRDSDAIAIALLRTRARRHSLWAGWPLSDLPEPDAASALFQAAYRSAERHTAGGAALRAASAFWDAKVAQHAGDRGSFAVWMRRAALEGDTFYALIARRALGPAMACIAGETIGNADVEALLATAQGRRAFALLQVGERRLAEAELRALWVDTAQDGLFDRSIALRRPRCRFHPIGVRDRAEPHRAAAERRGAGPTAPGAGLCGRSAAGLWRWCGTSSNFQTDRRIAHRSAGSDAIDAADGARGWGAETDQLHDPAVNLAIGQKYLLSLAQ